MVNTRAISVVLIGLFLLLQYKLWIAGDGIAQTVQLRKAIATQTASNDLLAKKNQELNQQISELSKGQGAVEGLAREELGMVKSDEQFYQFVT